MAVIEFDDLSSVSTPTYANYRYGVMTDIWGTNFKPYIDKDGVARIGPGIALADYLTEATQAMMGADYDDDVVSLLMTQVMRGYDKGDTDLLRNRLNNVMSDWAIDHGLDAGLRKFQFADADQSKLVLDLYLVAAENRLDTIIPQSEERAAIIALFGEGVRDIHMDAIIRDLIADDRPSAWFDIRYLNSGFEGGPPQTAAIAARRYIQSDVFELYNDPGNVSADEAEAVGQMYSKYRGDIIPYENKYDPDISGLPNAKGKADGSIVAQLQPAMHAIADNYHIDIGRMEELLYVNVATGATFFGDDPGDNFNSKRNDDDLIIGGDGMDALIGGAGNDTILGDTQFSTDSQVDTLDGGAGNDRLYGGGDADTLIGGAGNDQLWGGGDPGDHLDGGKGNDTYHLTDDDSIDVGGYEGPGGGQSLDSGTNDDLIVEAKDGGTDTVVAYISGEDFDIKNVEKFKLAGTGEASVLLNQFDDFILSSGNDHLTLTINKLQRTPIDIKTGGGADTISIVIDPSVDPSQVLDHKGLTARFRFSDLSANDVIDLTSIGIEDVIMRREKIYEDKGFYLMAPHAKLDFMENGHIDKTYNNSTDSWFVVKLGTSTPYGPEFMGDIDRSHFML